MSLRCFPTSGRREATSDCPRKPDFCEAPRDSWRLCCTPGCLRPILSKVVGRHLTRLLVALGASVFICAWGVDSSRTVLAVSGSISVPAGGELAVAKRSPYYVRVNAPVYFGPDGYPDETPPGCFQEAVEQPDGSYKLVTYCER